MRDVLSRVQRALPAVRHWIAQLHGHHAPQAVAAGALPFQGLAKHFPKDLLRDCRAVAVDAVPFPPVADLELPEFVAMADMDLAGITFGHMYFVRRDHDVEPVHFHELVHTVQWAVLGFDAFLLTYAAGLLQYGYDASPLEHAAYDLQARFERGEALPQVMDFIRWHATESHATATRLLESLGLHEGA